MLTQERGVQLRHQPALDGLRGVALLIIVAYHDGYGWAKGGFLTLDAFFVLSGFLITSLLLREYQQRGAIDLLAFWARRARRLLPALLVMLAVVAVYSYFAVPDAKLGQLRGDGLASIFYVANWRFISVGESYFDLFAGVSPLRHLWSLAIEEQFYLLWPLLFIAVLKLSKGSTRWLAGVTIGGIALSVLTIGVQYVGADPSRAYYGTDGRAHTLLVGCLLAILLPHLTPRTPRAHQVVQGAGLLAAVLSLAVMTQITDHSVGYYRGGSLLFAVGVAAMILASIQPVRSPVGSFFSLKALRWTGLISYGLYLWHWPINTFMTEGRVGVSGDMLNLLRLVVTFLFAIASYFLVENPIRRGLIGRRMARAVTPAGIAVVTVAFLTATATAAPPPDYLGGGTGWRLPCDAPSAELRAQADEETARYRFADPPPGMPGHVLVVGDSAACSLSLGLRAIGEPLGMTISDASVIGCGVAAGQVFLPDEEFPQTTEDCPPLVHDRITAAAAEQPTDAVVWLSSWERADQVVDGKLVEFDSRAGRRLVARQFEDTYQLIRTETPAPIYLLTTAPPGPGNYQDGELRGARSNDVRFAELDRQLAAFARRHPDDVHLLDLSARVCPTGPPCGTLRGGYNPRADDGMHFSVEGSGWAARWLIPKLTAAP
jgi:peptidoglycan/LPS O-acetylase OafA/YrhL